MLKCRSHPILLLVLLLFIGLLHAQSSQVLELTLDRALELALQKNKDIKVSYLEVKKSKEKLKEARGNLFPSIDASGQYTRNIKKPVIFLPPGTPFGPPGGGPAVLEIGYDNSYTGSVSASFPLFSKTLYSSLSVAKRNHELARESFRDSKIKTIANVKKSFYGVLLAKSVKDFMQMSLKNAEDNLKNVRRMHKQGLVSDYDLIRAEVQVENIRPVAMQAEDNFQLAKDALKIAIGLDGTQEIKVRGELQYDPSFRLPGLNEALNQVLDKNSTLRQLHFQSLLTKSMIGLEKSSFFPTLIAFGNYQYQTQANDFKFSDYRWVKTTMVGLQLQFPIFHGLSRFAKVQQAQLSHRQVLEQQSAVTEAIKTQLKSILYRIEQARKRIEAQQKSISQAELGYRIAKSRYKNGLGTQLEVNDAEVALTQARVNYAQAIYDYLVAIADYEALTGQEESD